MKTRVKRVVSFLILLILCSMGMVSYAAEQKINDFVFKLGVGVHAKWSDAQQRLYIIGDGKIESDKWRVLAQHFNREHSGKTIWTDSNRFTIVFEDKTVQFPDNTMIGDAGFFEGFGGEILLPNDMDVSNVTNMNSMFKNAPNANPDVSAWHPQNLETMKEMFNGASSFEELDLMDWGRMMNVEANGAFLNLPNLKYLEFDGLKFDQGERVHLNRFAGAYFVERLEGENKTEIIGNPAQGYHFNDNVHYRLSLLCTVKFDSDGGSEIANAIVGYGATVSQPQNPTKKGFTFVRWEKGGAPYHFNEPVYGDITLRAIWKASDSGAVTPIDNENLTVTLQVGSHILKKESKGTIEEVLMDAVPFVEQGRVMLPLRYAAEALGMGVSWDNQTKVVTLKDKTNEVIIPVRTIEIIVNGKTFYSDVKPILKNGRVFLSVSNIAKPLGLEHGKTIFWDNETKTATFVRKLSEI